jgi:hypothetical protein
MMTLAIIASVVLLVAGVAALLHAVKHAPEGYEDELGFHEGVEPWPHEALQAALSVPIQVQPVRRHPWSRRSMVLSGRR